MKKTFAPVFIKIFCIALLSFLSTIILINFACDPIQWLRRSPGKILVRDQRLQVPGFVKNFDYDLVMVGNSVTENFSHKLIKQLVPSKPIFLSIAGAGTLEQTIPLKKALESGKVKTVIWGLTQTLAYKDHTIPSTFPLYLYENTVDSHFKYLFSFRTLQLSFSYLGKSLFRPSKPDAELIENYRHKLRSLLPRKALLDIYKNALSQTKSICPAIMDYSEAQLKEKNFLNDVLPLIKQYPHVQFYIFLPPYSLVLYKLSHHNDCVAFENTLRVRQFIFENLIPLPNVKIYDFETDLSIIGNLDHYEDTMHYGPALKDEMLIKMKNNINLVTAHNMHQKNADFRQKVLLPLE